MRSQRQQTTDKTLSKRGQTGCFQAIHDMHAIGETGNMVEDFRTRRVMPRIAADEQHVDRPLAMPVRVHFRIDRRRKPFCTTALATPSLQDRGEIAEHGTIGRQIGLPGRCSPPAQRLSNASRQSANERTRKANGIEVVKNLGSVVLDLSQQNVLQRGLGGNSVLVRPLPLHALVVAAGEE